MWRELVTQPSLGNPFYFFNACQVGRSQSTGGFVQGWGPVLIGSGAGGFIGGQWKLVDFTASQFSVDFYRRLSLASGEHFLTDILREVRRNFYETGDPTFLAYAFFGNANLRAVRPGS
jgi:hypothetical protein